MFPNATIVILIVFHFQLFLDPPPPTFKFPMSFMDGLLAGIQFNDVVVIAGCGPIGLGMIAAAKMKNPKFIIALGKELIFLYVNQLDLLTYICGF